MQARLDKVQLFAEDLHKFISSQRILSVDSGRDTKMQADRAANNGLRTLCAIYLLSFRSTCTNTQALAIRRVECQRICFCTKTIPTSMDVQIANNTETGWNL